MMKTVTVL